MYMSLMWLLAHALCLSGYKMVSLHLDHINSYVRAFINGMHNFFIPILSWSVILFLQVFISRSRGQAWRSGEVLPTCAKRSWVRTSLSALHFAGVRLGSYNPSPDPTLCGSFYALGLSFFIYLFLGQSEICLLVLIWYFIQYFILF